MTVQAFLAGKGVRSRAGEKARIAEARRRGCGVLFASRLTSGLLTPGERKSVEAMAAVVAPARVLAKHQSLFHLVSQAAWSDAAILAKVRERAARAS